MTMLTSVALQIPAGHHQSASIPVPNGLKRSGIPLNLRIALDSSTFPLGRTTIAIAISTDGGLTYRTASGVVDETGGPKPPFWFLGLSLGENDSPTHVKYSTDAPDAFTTNVTLEVS